MINLIKTLKIYIIFYLLEQVFKFIYKPLYSTQQQTVFILIYLLFFRSTFIEFICLIFASRNFLIAIMRYAGYAVIILCCLCFECGYQIFHMVGLCATIFIKLIIYADISWARFRSVIRTWWLWSFFFLNFMNGFYFLVVYLLRFLWKITKSFFFTFQ